MIKSGEVMKKEKMDRRNQNRKKLPDIIEYFPGTYKEHPVIVMLIKPSPHSIKVLDKRAEFVYYRQPENVGMTGNHCGVDQINKYDKSRNHKSIRRPELTILE